MDLESKLGPMVNNIMVNGNSENIMGMVLLYIQKEIEREDILKMVDAKNGWMEKMKKRKNRSKLENQYIHRAFKMLK